MAGAALTKGGGAERQGGEAGDRGHLEAHPGDIDAIMAHTGS
jgi:hypothetical protein